MEKLGLKINVCRCIKLVLVVTLLLGGYMIYSTNFSTHILPLVTPLETTETTTVVRNRSGTERERKEITSGVGNRSDTEREKKLFNATITEKEREMFRTLLTYFSENVPSNMTYFLYGGTLLGSYRHHGMIPWDDDLDLLVKEQDRHMIPEHLSSLSNYTLHRGGAHSWKFFHKGSMKTRFSWRWPFLDIFFYQENATCLWDTHPSWRYKKYLKEDIFPLIKRPFMGLMLPAPRHTGIVLGNLYEMDICETNFYDHKHEKFLRGTMGKLPCKELKDKFPFVRREYFPNKIVETLQIEGSQSTDKNLSTFTIIN